ncbi:hypothetical protein GECvBMG_gp236 [Salmonella phage GEC_vB_MG]|nr:hypothetical protein GECvBMG_gp236 [Salmonella phage GEC_vB_MG]
MVSPFCCHHKGASIAVTSANKDPSLSINNVSILFTSR